MACSRWLSLSPCDRRCGFGRELHFLLAKNPTPLQEHRTLPLRQTHRCWKKHCRRTIKETDHGFTGKHQKFAQYDDGKL